MFSLNPSFDLLPEETQIEALFERKTYEQGASAGLNPVRQQLYETCAQLGVGYYRDENVIRRAVAQCRSLAVWCVPMTVAQCEHYALTRPGVASVLIGCVSG